MIIDAYGQPLSSGRDLRTPQSARVARFARPWLDSALRGLKPRDVARALDQADLGDLIAQHRLFADMEDRDSHIAAELQKRSLAVARLPWTVEPPTDASDAERRAVDGVRDILAGGIDALADTACDLLAAVGHGFSAVEIAWQRRDGLWLPDLYPQPQEWFTISQDGRELLLISDSGLGDPLQPFGWIVHRPRRAKTGYLARGGVYRALVWPFVYKSFALGDFAEFLETFGLPFIVGKYGADANEDDRAKLLAAVAQLAHDARAIMPIDMKLEIEKIAGDASGMPHLRMLEWCDAAISRALLGQTLSSQATATGLGSGVADLQAEVRDDIRDGDAAQLAATLTRELIWPIATLNFGLTDPRRSPRLVFDTSQTEDIAVYADALPKLAAVGLPIPVGWAAKRLGIPQPGEGEAVLGAPGVNGEPVANRMANPTNTSGSPMAALVASNADKTPSGDYHGPEDDPTPVSLMVEQMDRETAPAWVEIMDAVRRMVDEAESLEALRDALLGAYGDLPTDRLTEVVALGFAAANLAGRYDVQRGH